jgi:hypothetical protein
MDNTEIFVVTFSLTTYEEITEALENKKICICEYNDNNAIYYGLLLYKSATSYYFRISDGKDIVVLLILSEDNTWSIINDDSVKYMNKKNPTGTGHLSINRKEGFPIGDYSSAIGYYTIAT